MGQNRKRLVLPHSQFSLKAPAGHGTIATMMWVIFALLSALFAALVSITGKIALKNIDPVTMTTLRAVAMAIIMIAIATATNKLKIPKLSSHDTIFLILAAISGALSWTFYFIALKHGPVKGVYAIDKLSVVILVIGAALFLSEKLTLKSVLGAVFMFIGALLLNF